MILRDVKTRKDFYIPLCYYGRILIDNVSKNLYNKYNGFLWDIIKTCLV